MSSVKDSEIQGWVGFDLDGTLAEYTGWKGIDHIGAPIPLMVQRLLWHIAAGHTVKIFTARVFPGYTVQRRLEACQAELAIREWCKRHIGVELDVTCVKDFGMIKLYDDRLVQVEPNTGRILEDELRLTKANMLRESSLAVLLSLELQRHDDGKFHSSLRYVDGEWKVGE